MGPIPATPRLFTTGLSRFGLAQVVVVVRLGVVLSSAILVASRPNIVTNSTSLTAAIVLGAILYAAVLIRYPAIELRGTRWVWAVVILDSGFALSIIAITGGVYSLGTLILVLVVIGANARLPALDSILFTLGLAAIYLSLGLGLGINSPSADDVEPWVEVVWTTVYLVFTGALVGSVNLLTEREQRNRLTATILAKTERAAAEEERDLRSRLLQSYENQQDGLSVLLHEFRSPISSITSLSVALDAENFPMSESDRLRAIALMRAHSQHVSDMLDALAEVALSRRPAFSSGRIREVILGEVVLQSSDSAGLGRERLRLTLVPSHGTARLDAQALRRVLTNLIENAARHGFPHLVEVGITRSAKSIAISVSDRGPGVGSESIGVVSQKFVSLGDRRGTAGLGLWVVRELVDAMGGRIEITARDGGGLVVQVSLPIV